LGECPTAVFRHPKSWSLQMMVQNCPKAMMHSSESSRTTDFQNSELCAS
jgi:hypothetical protein